MHVNNEIGVIQDIAAIAAVCAGSALGAAARRCGSERRQVRVGCRRAGASISCRCRRTRSTDPKGPARWSCRASAAFSCNPCNTAEARSAACAPAPWRRIRWWAWERHSRSQGRRRPRRRERIAALRERLVAGAESRSAACCATAIPPARVPHLLNVSFEGVEGESLLAAVRPHHRRVDRIGLHVDPSGAFLCPARARPRRSACRKQPAVQSRPLLERRPMSIRRFRWCRKP